MQCLHLTPFGADVLTAQKFIVTARENGYKYSEKSKYNDPFDMLSSWTRGSEVLMS